MVRPNGLKLRVSFLVTVFLLAAGCGTGGQQAAVPPTPEASQPRSSQPATPAASSALAAGGDQTAAPSASSSSQALSDAPKVKACDLLTKEEVAEAVGRPVANVQVDRDDPNYTACSYFYYLPEGTEFYVFVSYDRTKNAWDEQKPSDQGGGSTSLHEPVAGIGDEAYYFRLSQSVGASVKGGVLWVSLVGTPKNIDGKAAVVGLAKKAAGRI